MGIAAKEAAFHLATASTAQKNKALSIIADELEANAATILEANAKDIELGREAGLTDALLDRLLLNEERLTGIANDVRNVISLNDPVGSEMDSKVLENGMSLSRRRVPLGVVGVIYEARPNVTIDIAALCLKTGNASILRGGKEPNYSADHVGAIKQELEASKLPPQKPVDETSIKTKRKVNPDVVAVFDLDNEGWRSFRWDSITEFNTGA